MKNFHKEYQMATSSIHIEKGKAGYLSHNDRSRPTKNSIFSDEDNEVSNTAKEAFEIYRKELAKRSEAYTSRTKQKLQAKAITHLSAIINLNSNHNLEDLKPLINHLESELDTKVFQVSIHRDEGHIDEESKKPIKNYHAHLEFMGLDGEGRSVRKKLDKKFLSNLQTKVAEILQMERGTNYAKERKKRPKRLGTYEFKDFKKREENSRIIEKKELAKEIESLKQKLQKAGAKRADYAQLEQVNKELKEKLKSKTLTSDELAKELEKLKVNNPLFKGLFSSKKDDEISKLKKQNTNLKKQNSDAKSIITDLLKANGTDGELVVSNITKAKANHQKNLAKVQELERENSSLKEKMKALEKELNSNKQFNEISTTHSYQHKLYFEKYKALVTSDLRGYFVKSEGLQTNFFNKKIGVKVRDLGDRIEANGTNTKEQVKLILDIAQAKGWNLANLNITGGEEFISEVKSQASKRIFRQMRTRQIVSEAPEAPAPEPDEDEGDYLYDLFNDEPAPAPEPEPDELSEEEIIKKNYQEISNYQDITNPLEVPTSQWMQTYRAIGKELEKKYGRDSEEEKLLKKDFNERYHLEDELYKEKMREKSKAPQIPNAPAPY